MLRRYRHFLEKECGINGFRELCMVAFEYAQLPLESHIHPDAMEICFLYRGRQTYQVNEDLFTMNGLDVFVTYPNEVHGSGTQPEEKSVLYYMIIDTVNDLEHFLGFNDGEAAWVAEQLNKLPQRLFHGSERIRYLWDELQQLCAQPHSARIAMLRATALLLMMEILHCSNSEAAHMSPDIVKALKHIGENIEGWLPLAALAEVCGLSLARFKQKFRDQVGMPPGEYILREKVRRAEALLGAGHTVTYTAHQLNFSSSQHLSVVYKKFTGQSPRERGRLRESKR